MKKLRHLFYVIILIAFDQFTKYQAITQLKGKESFQLIPNVLEFYYHENTGAVWGLLSGKTSFLVLFSSIIMVGMIFIYFKIPEEKRYNLLRIVMIFITAGAIGNLIDRSIRKFVVDFIYIELIDFPIFNLADCYITLSSALLILLSLFYYKDSDFEFLNLKKNTIIEDDEKATNKDAIDGIEVDIEDGNNVNK